MEKQRKRIGTLIENTGIYPNMTVEENLEVAIKLFRDKIEEKYLFCLNIFCEKCIIIFEKSCAFGRFVHCILKKH
ncbi:MAG: hypothetical protein K2I10_12985 [Lachnospiraceae bacterium]|nr:hypothetical protein [Lachnospiraceae bacterium]